MNIKEIQDKLSSWYRSNCRNLPWRKTHNPYKIWISEVMLQQTQVKTVIPYYHKFIEAFPTIKDLALADQQKVLKMWEGLGYYARARNLLKASNLIVENYEGKIPAAYDEILKVPGVGEYIASAVLSIAFSKPHAVVDGNVKRVLARLFLMNDPVNQTKSYKTYKQLAQSLLDMKNPGIHNQAVMELGALLCKPVTPDCERCPVINYCKAYTKNKVGEFPVKIKKKPVPVYKIAVGVVVKDNRLLITKRKPEGLLGGLWEFPGGKLKKKEDAKKACKREIFEETGLSIKVVKHLTFVKHAYTHFKIQMDVFICQHLSGKIELNGPVGYKWVSVKDLDQYPFPKANLKFFEDLNIYCETTFGQISNNTVPKNSFHKVKTNE
jgi:A/G-specific adenine glycosylase